MAALAGVPSTGGHVNVLQHIAGYFSRSIGRDERQKLGELIDALAPPRAQADDAYLARQTYLQRSELLP